MWSAFVRKKEPKSPDKTMCTACFVGHKAEMDTHGRLRHWNADKSESVICGDWLCEKMSEIERKYWLDKWARHI